MALRALAPETDAADGLTVDVLTSAASIEAEWRALESMLAVAVYQSFDWIDSWLDTAAPAQGVRPAIVALRRSGVLVGVLPLGIERLGPFRVARLLGGEHSNIRMPLLLPSFADTLDNDATIHLLVEIGRKIRGVDLLDLDAMPLEWRGRRNPLAAHADARPARCGVPSMTLSGDFQAVLRAHRGAKKTKKHRWQVNTLAEVGGFRLRRAETEPEAHEMLSAYLAQKAVWFRQQGIADAFAAPGIAAFFRELIRRRFAGQSGLIELDALEFDGEIRAILGSGTAHHRLSGYFLSVSDDAWKRVSPGELLLYETVSSSSARGIEALDLGRGEERYKMSWLDIPEPHRRLLVPVTAAGRMAAGLLRLADFAERSVRENQHLWHLAKRVRRLRNSAETPDE